MNKRIYVLIIAFNCLLQVYAQRGETKVPLQSNPVLQQYVQEHPEEFKTTVLKQQLLAKTSSGYRFPFIERFNYNGDLSDSLWQNDFAKKQGRSVIFDARDANGNPYNSGGGNFGQCDLLTTQPINLYLSQNRLYVYFNYSTGATWQSGDSLVLQLQASGGNYINIWVSPDANVSNEDVIILIPDLTDYIAPQFTFRLVNYTTQLASNTENFIVHFIALADKWSLPAYENFTTYDTAGIDQPSEVLWMQHQTAILPGAGISGNAVIFDAKDEYGAIYNNANGATGYADTLMSNLIDVQHYDASDSVYLSFYYESTAATKNTDSLIVEYRNNVGAWIRIWQDGGQLTPTRKVYTNQINIGRFRHSSFQFRIIGKCNYSANDSLQFILSSVSIGKKLFLPFLDDFSNSSIYPDQKKWLTKHTYVNNHFPIKPPSINVATFDGLDSRGNAYGTGRGYCDTLTSHEIDISAYQSAADSVYLSFFIQPKGNGERPNTTDSLVLEFRNNPGNPNQYIKVWGTTLSGLPTDRFTRIDVLLSDSSVFHNAFQFRFKNIGSRTGNLNHWHIDYIRLDKGRTKGDDYFDVAVNANSGSLLTPYASMPYKHFAINPASFLKPQQFVGFKNNAVTPYPIEYNRNVYDPFGNIIDPYSNILPSFAANSDTTILINDAVTLSNPGSFDSIVYNVQYSGKIQGNLDNIPYNDSITIPTIFSNYFAYDDGSAESGYALKNTDGSVALAYDLKVADTLVGLSIFFNQSTTNVSDMPFDLMVWSAINTNGNGTGETVLARLTFSGPKYQNKINGFHYLELNPYIILPAGKIYVGWEQDQLFELNVGMDDNYSVNGNNVNPNLFYKIDDLWQQTQLSGALMIRPLLGKYLTPPTGLNEKVQQAKLDLNVYPNPSNGNITLETEGEFPLHVLLYDIAGRQLFNHNIETETLHLPALNDGLYVLHIKDATGRLSVKKIIIKH